LERSSVVVFGAWLMRRLSATSAPMKAFIQHSNGLPTNVNTYTALRGFELRGAAIEPFTSEELESGALSVSLEDGDIVCGYVGVVQKALTLLGLPKPRIQCWPDELAEQLGRRVWRTTLGEVRGLETPVFLKPALDDKAFHGHVRNAGGADASLTAYFGDGFEVLCSEVIDLVSEWRCFIVDGRPIDARQYKGSFRTPQPDYSVLDECLSRFSTAPRGYALDLGVTAGGATLLVEVNDGYSLGSYGLGPAAYANLLSARWSELVRAALPA